jgi:stringent starvation protein B
VLAIYARETGQGMIFADEDANPSPPAGEAGPPPSPDDDGPPKPSPSSGGRARLKVVK